MLIKKGRELYGNLSNQFRYKKSLLTMIKNNFHAKEAHSIRFVFWGSPEYNNLGDHAIAYAIINFLKTNFSHIPIVEISENMIITSYQEALEKLSTKDIIVLTGGGNLGNQYIDQRLIRNAAIRTFRKNPIIIFPQTAFYTMDARGRHALREDRKVFLSHEKLHIFLREEISYEFMREHFSRCNLYCVPDMVLSLDKQYESERNGVLLCLRNDVESILSEEEKCSIKKRYPKAKLIDTCLNRDVLISERECELERIWRMISEAEFVVTDRLHGTIFCAITGTPCISISNYNHKIASTMKWLVHCSNIVYSNSGLNINTEIPREVKKINWNCEFEKLVEVLKNLIADED